MRHPSLRRAAGQGPVLVGTIGSLWPSWVLVGVGDGAAGLRDARQEGRSRAEGVPRPLLGVVDMGKGRDHKRQIQSSSSSS